MADIPAIILERIEAVYPGPALFSAAEIDDWPNGSLDHLRDCGILRPAQRAEAVVCPGCGWQCHKPVVVRSLRAGVGKRAFVVCDEEPDYGRIAVNLRSLDQYRATIDGLSVFLAAQMDLGPPRPSPSGTIVELGTMRGRNGQRQVSVDLDGRQLLLRVGRQHDRVVRVLRWTDRGLSVDKSHIRRLVNRKESQHMRAARLPELSRQEQRSRETQARDEAIFRDAKGRHAAGGGSWTAIANAIAVTDLSKIGLRRRIGAPTVRRIIAKMLRREGEKFRSNRKERK